MPEDDDNLNDFTLPPHSNEDADTQLDAKALKLVESYVASLNRSKNENDIRGEIRGNIVKLGIHSLAFQHELTAQKMMDAADRRDYMAGRRRMGRVLADKQDSLFPEEVERIKKRKERAKEKAAKAAAAAGAESPEAQERRLAADSSPRSKPKASSAVEPKKRGRKPKAVAGSAAERAAETSERVERLAETAASSPGATPADKPWPDDEQTEGANVLDGMLASTKARAADETGLTGTLGLGSVADEKPLSQSAQTQAIREQLGLDKA